jgi:hypothetical protein
MFATMSLSSALVHATVLSTMVVRFVIVGESLFYFGFLPDFDPR